jgi:hypothetical protein
MLELEGGFCESRSGGLDYVRRVPHFFQVDEEGSSILFNLIKQKVPGPSGLF